MHSRQGVRIPAPFGGAPGPPPPCSYILVKEDEEEMLIGNDPDDLGDLMQEMREGAWAEELAMDSMPLALAAPAGGAGLASPAAQPRAAGAPEAQAPSEACLQGLQELSVMTQRCQREQLAEQDAAAARLQPGVRALLMHPGGARGGAFMVPCTAGPPPACREPGAAWPSCAASLAASGPPAADGCAPAWPPPHYFGAPAAPTQPSPFYAMPLAAAPPLASAPAAPFHLYQTAPPAFAAPGQPLPGYAAGPAGGACYPLPPLPQPNSSGGGGSKGGSGGSDGASDGTTLRLRNSLDGDTDGTAATGAAPAHPHAAVPQMCSAAALAAFDQAAFDAPGYRADWRGGAGSGTGGAGKCASASSDSSDCEAGRECTARLPRVQSATQVVPDAMCNLPGCLPPPPLPPPSAFAGFPPLPTLCTYYESPATQTARLARHASLERYRAKKARRGSGTRIRYQARKANADRRPRVKGRFVKAEEGAQILAAAAAAGAAGDGMLVDGGSSPCQSPPPEPQPAPCASLSAGTMTAICTA